MITDDDVLRLFERADPARVDDAASVVDVAGDLDGLETRSIDVTLIDIDRPPSEPTSRRRWPIIAAAAAGVVLFVGGALVFAARGDETDQPTVAMTAAEEVARAFYEADAAHDADRALGYLTDAVIAAEWGTPDQYRLTSRFFEALRMKTVNIVCENQRESASDITVRCTSESHGLGSDELGLGPYPDGYRDLTVRDGKIVSMSVGDQSLQPFSDQMWVPFASWVARTYPDDISVMYDDSSATGWRMTEESIPLWGQRVREYGTTREAFIARADAICTAAHGRLNEQLRADGMETRDDAGLEYERAAAGILDETVAELRAVPAPEAVRTEFDHGYSLVEQLAQALRGTGTDTVATMDQIAQVGLGLFDCTFALRR